MKNFNELLIEFKACMEARAWARRMTIEEVVEKCERGDWLLWLAKKVNIDNRNLTLAKGLCVNTVRHLMKDERSLSAVDAAIAYGKGEVGIEELTASYATASASAVSAAAYAAYAASDAASDAASAHAAAVASADAAADAADYAADYAAYAAARKKNLMQTANICREVIGQEIIEKVNELLN